MTEEDFIKNHIFIVAPKNQFKKGILKATNNFKDISSVFILKLNQSGNDTYLRKYTIMADNEIYCFDLIGGNDKSTDLKDLADIEKLKEYDNKNYGGFF